MIFNQPISLFKNATSTVPVTVTLEAFLNSRRHIADIEAIRAHNNKELRDEFKKRLPAATISGTFKERRISGIETYNGLLCMDFDHADNADDTPEAMKAMLAEFSEVAYAATSVGGKGVFAIIPTNNTDPAQHPKLADFMRLVFIEIGLLADPSCKDVCRLRFVSYDATPYINPAPRVFDAVRWLREQQEAERTASNTRPAKAQGGTAEKVERYLAALESQQCNVAHYYREWLLIGFALATEFGASGENYFHRVSALSSKYDYSKTQKKYAELVRNSSGRVRIGTFFKLCQETGIRL